MDEENQLKLERLELSDEECISTDRSSQKLDKELAENLDNEKPHVDGKLDADVVYTNISNIQKSHHGSYQNLTFSGVNLNLRDISILGKYTHLQSVDVSNNQISDLSAFGNLHSLLILNASNNHIVQLLDFKPPNNLKHADFSHNAIEEIPDLAAHHYLTELYLDHNRIGEIKGLSECHRLSRLSLSHNRISRIKNIESLPLLYLNLSNNQISQIENLETIHWLREIDLSCNLLCSLHGLAKHHLLEAINVNDNHVQDIEEIQHIKDLSLLQRFTILRNPIEQMPNYHLAILFQIQRLTQLNGAPVSFADKVEALNQFDPCLEVVAAKTHMRLTYYSFLKPCRILDITMPNINDHYPMLVMVGPEGSDNKKLAMELAEKFSENFGYGILETTREMLPGEVDGKDYNFTTANHFHQEVVNGEFIVTSEYQGNYYGLKSKTLENIAKEGKGCITHMKLEAMVTLKNSYLQPRFILTVHSSRQAQKTHMNDTGLYTEEELESALQSWDAITEYNQDHPGAFFIVIILDCLKTAYQKLEQLIQSWIGASEKLPKLSTIGDSSLETETVLPHSSVVAEESAYIAPVIGVVEKESLRRRYETIHKAVQSYVPPLYDQITTAASSDTRAAYNRSLSQSVPLLDQPRSISDSDDESAEQSLHTLRSDHTCMNPLAESKSSNRTESTDKHVIRLLKGGSVVQLLQSSQTEYSTENSGLNSKSKTFVMEPTPPSSARSQSSNSSQRRSRLRTSKHVLPPITTAN